MLTLYHSLKNNDRNVLSISDLHSYFYVFIRVAFDKSISYMGAWISYLVGSVCQVLSGGGLPPCFFQLAIPGKGWGRIQLGAMDAPNCRLIPERLRSVDSVDLPS